MATFQQLSIPSGTTKYLNSVRFGTLSATTANNAVFGITANRKITLHVVSVDSTLSIGGLQDFRDYGTLVQEIVTTIAANKNTGSQQLLDFLLGN